jgi:chaperone required for assembly of F1-ATPase
VVVRLEMKLVTIRRCPTTPSIDRLAISLADTLRRDRNATVTIVDGSHGEFSVEMDGHPVAEPAGEPLLTGAGCGVGATG